MGSHVYNVVEAPIGWSLFCDRERIGGYVSSEAALEAATAFGAKAVREGTAFRSTCLHRNGTNSRLSNRGRRVGTLIQNSRPPLCSLSPIRQPR
jgi:hypothetical protein